jgi:hypothetical protein
LMPHSILLLDVASWLVRRPRPLVPTLERGGMRGGGWCHNSVKTGIFKILFMTRTAAWMSGNERMGWMGATRAYGTSKHTKTLRVPSCIQVVNILCLSSGLKWPRMGIWSVILTLRVESQPLWVECPAAGTPHDQKI